MSKSFDLADSVNDNSIPGSRIENGAIDSAKIEDGSITNADISPSAAISSAKSSFVGAGSGAVARSAESKMADIVSVKDFGAVGDGVTDDTQAFQAALDYASGLRQVFIPAGRYKITDTLNLYKGSNVVGVNLSQGVWAYTAGYKSSMIEFSPASTKDLFTVQNLPAPAQSFKGHVAVTGLYIFATNSDARYAFDLPTVIYGRFSDIEIRSVGSGTPGFDAGFNVVNSINNRFNNIRIESCSVACVKYSGTAPPTTDVWDQCTFQYAPVGVLLESGISIRFSNCLFEALYDYGVDIYKDCRSIEAISCYSEDVPLNNNPNGSIFRVGHSGTTSSQATVLKILGGSYAGRNAGVVGSFLDIDDVRGCQIVSPYVARFTNLVKTTANTRPRGISICGVQYNSVTNVNVGPSGRLSGFWDFQAVNSLGNGPIASFDTVNGGSAVNAVTLNATAFVRLTPTTAPATPAAGTIYFDNGTSKLRCWDGSTWKDLF